MMPAISVPQPWASAVVERVEQAIAWPGDWPLQPEAVGRWVAIHSTVAWSEAQARAAADLGLKRCPRGEVLGVARVRGWARQRDGVQWLGADAPDDRALVDGWPLTGGPCALFFDDAARLADGPPLVCLGDASAPWRLPPRLHSTLRSRWGQQPASPRVVPSGRGVISRAPKPATVDAQATADRLADLLPPGWATRVDGFTVSILDPGGTCRRALLTPHDRDTLADILVGVVQRFGAGPIDALVGHIRARHPWVPPAERRAS